MSPEPIVRLDGVSLCYRLAKQRIPSLKEFAIHWVKGALQHEELWAVRDISLQVREGESIGIIGRNGAGKSTLLKVISGVLKPTEGSVQVRGRVAPILELGTGFDFELTGIENIYLNALLLGHQRAEIDKRLDEIIDFSGLAEFVHTPLRNYSTGMVARLGFSVATAWIPDLLILDEVLGVGDSRFLERCEKRLQRFEDHGTAVFLVSHLPESILATCERCLWIDRGRLIADGEAHEVLEKYERFSRSNHTAV